LNDVDKLLNKVYKKYCNGTDHCFVLTCPVNSLMMNMARHAHEGNKFLLYGDYMVLEDLAK